MKKNITILTPCFNDESTVRGRFEAVRSLFEQQLPEYSFDYIFIDNCSTDRTAEILRDMAGQDKRVKVIVNSRKFDQHISLYYGMLQMSSDAVIPLFADEFPLQIMVDFVKKWDEGNLMVLGVRQEVKEGFFFRQAKRQFYWLVNNVSNVKQIKNFMGYGIYDRKIIEILRRLDNRSPYLKGLIAEIGYDKVILEYEPVANTIDNSNSGGLTSLIDVAILGISSSSQYPIRLMTIIGGAISLLSFLVALTYFVLKLVNWNDFDMGLAPAIIGTFFFGSVQLLCIGWLGEYVSRIIEHVKAYPLVLEKERINF
ncbi:MAG: glycosyltransferase family 2 protein [Magnetococcales bacterium]|nr:glycosyltransferase family 2 protein [Magnetococcales bacterium]